MAATSPFFPCKSQTAQSQQSTDLNILHCTKLRSSLAVNTAIREAATWNANMASSLADSPVTWYLSVMGADEEKAGGKKEELSG